MPRPKVCFIHSLEVIVLQPPAPPCRWAQRWRTKCSRWSSQQDGTWWQRKNVKTHSGTICDGLWLNKPDFDQTWQRRQLGAERRPKRLRSPRKNFPLQWICNRFQSNESSYSRIAKKVCSTAQLVHSGSRTVNIIWTSKITIVRLTIQSYCTQWNARAMKTLCDRGEPQPCW